jgi:hypothetical protein
MHGNSWEGHAKVSQAGEGKGRRDNLNGGTLLGGNWEVIWIGK